MPDQHRRRSLAIVSATAGAAVFGPAVRVARAQTYPSRPITMIIAFPPGGASDIVGRAAAVRLGERLGQPVVVENRAGAGGNLGAKQAALARPDGYTILLGATTALSISQTLTPETANFSVERDFAPISMLGKVPLYVLVNPRLAVRNLKELIALAKARPGQVTVASAGIGTTQHLGAELFEMTAGIDLLHIPYKGSGPAMTDLVGGQVDCTFETGPAAMSFIKSGQVRALAFASSERSALLPDLPTAAEAGLAGFEVSATYGLLAPAGTPAEVITRLNEATRVILDQPELKAQFADQGVITTYTTPEQMADGLKLEIAKWARVIKVGNVKAQ